MAEAFVYMWFDVPTGKRYIGVRKGTPEGGYVCSSKPMMKAYKERPHDLRRQIMYHGTWMDMLTKEQALIAEYNAVKDPMFYNQASGLGPYHFNFKGVKRGPLTQEVKEKISKALKGRKLSEDRITKMSTALRGRKLSENHKEKLSKASRGNKNGLGNKGFTGRTHTEETKAKMSAAHIRNKKEVS